MPATNASAAMMTMCMDGVCSPSRSSRRLLTTPQRQEQKRDHAHGHRSDDHDRHDPTRLPAEKIQDLPRHEAAYHYAEQRTDDAPRCCLETESFLSSCVPHGIAPPAMLTTDVVDESHYPSLARLPSPCANCS